MLSRYITLLSFFAVTCSVAQAYSQTVTVHSVGPTCNFNTISDAVAAAADGDIIAIRPGQYFENLGTLGKDLIFTPAGTMCFPQISVTGIVIDGGGGQIADIQANVTFQQVTLQNGSHSRGGLVSVSSGALNFIDTELINGSAVEGGAVYCSDAELRLEGVSALRSNQADSFGGAVSSINCSLFIEDEVAFTDNSAELLGGALAYQASDLVIDGSAVHFERNSADEGGAIWAGPGSSTTITTQPNGIVSISENAAAHGGGLAGWLADTVTMMGNVDIRENSAVDGGGIYLRNDAMFFGHGSLLLKGGVQVINNQGGDGGGLFFENLGVIDIRGTVTIADNIASGSGGGIWSEWNGSFFLGDGAMVRNNQALIIGIGGGAVLLNNLSYEINGAVFKENEAYKGGGLYIRGGLDYVITDTDIQSNTANAQGGGIFFEDGGLDLFNVSLLANNAEEGGGGWFEHAIIHMDIDTSTCDPMSTPLPVRYCSQVRSNIGSGMTFTASEAFVHRTAFVGNDIAINSRAGSAVDIRGDALVTVTNSIFYDNSMSSGAPVVLAAEDLTFPLAPVGAYFEALSNTFADNNGRPVRYESQASGTFDQNIAQFNSKPLRIFPGAVVDMACNNTRRPTGIPASTLENQNNPNGLFKDQANDNYMLAIGSPSLNVCDVNSHSSHRPDLLGRSAVGFLDQGALEVQ